MVRDWTGLVRKFARIVSYIFDGSYISIPVFIIICFIVTEDMFIALRWALLCILFGLLVPNLYILFLLKSNRIEDIHLPDREDRIRPLIITNVSYLLGYFILHVLSAPLFLRSMFAIYVVSTLILTIITFFWKISFHTSWVTFVVITFCVLLGVRALFLLFLIPLVGWTRVKIERHTTMQVVMGSLVSAVTSLFIYSSYGFINLL